MEEGAPVASRTRSKPFSCGEGGKKWERRSFERWVPVSREVGVGVVAGVEVEVEVDVGGSGRGRQNVFPSSKNPFSHPHFSLAGLMSVAHMRYRSSNGGEPGAGSVSESERRWRRREEARQPIAPTPTIRICFLRGAAGFEIEFEIEFALVFEERAAALAAMAWAAAVKGVDAEEELEGRSGQREIAWRRTESGSASEAVFVGRLSGILRSSSQ